METVDIGNHDGVVALKKLDTTSCEKMQKDGWSIIKIVMLTSYDRYDNDEGKTVPYGVFCASTDVAVNNAVKERDEAIKEKSELHSKLWELERTHRDLEKRHLHLRDEYDSMRIASGTCEEQSDADIG